MESIRKSVLNLAKINLGIGSKEKVLVLTDDFDKERINLAKEVKEILSSKYDVDFLVYKNTGQNGKEPDKGTALKLLDYQVIIMINSFSLTHTSARKKASERGIRIASMPGFKREMFSAGMRADYNEIKRKGKNLIKLIKQQSNIASITSSNGTNLVLKFRMASVGGDLGIYTKKRDCGNLPAGEVFFMPESASGKLVINPGWFYHPKLRVVNSDSIEFVIKNSKIADIKGDDVASDLKKLFFKYPHRRIVAEFGIGLNSRARDIKSILEAEKILGTIHVAFGNNIYFGGKNNSDVHYDFILNKPTVLIGRKEIIRKGKYLI